MLNCDEGSPLMKEALGEGQGEEAEDRAVCRLGVMQESGVIADEEIALLEDGRCGADRKFADQIVPEAEALAGADLDQGGTPGEHLPGEGLKVGDGEGAIGVGSIGAKGDDGAPKALDAKLLGDASLLGAEVKHGCPVLWEEAGVGAHVVDEGGEGFEGGESPVSDFGEEGDGDDAIRAVAGRGFSIDVGGKGTVTCMPSPTDLGIGAVEVPKATQHRFGADEVAQAPAATEIHKHTGGHRYS